MKERNRVEVLANIVIRDNVGFWIYNLQHDFSLADMLRLGCVFDKKFLRPTMVLNHWSYFSMT